MFSSQLSQHLPTSQKSVERANQWILYHLGNQGNTRLLPQYCIPRSWNPQGMHDLVRTGLEWTWNAGTSIFREGKVGQVHVSGRPCESLSAPLYKKNRRETHFELCHSLPNKFLEIIQFIFVDHLLRNFVEEITHPSDYHLHEYWLDRSYCNRVEYRQQNMTIVTVIAA